MRAGRSSWSWSKAGSSWRCWGTPTQNPPVDSGQIEAVRSWEWERECHRGGWWLLDPRRGIREGWGHWGWEVSPWSSFHVGSRLSWHGDSLNSCLSKWISCPQTAPLKCPHLSQAGLFWNHFTVALLNFSFVQPQRHSQLLALPWPFPFQGHGHSHSQCCGHSHPSGHSHSQCRGHSHSFYHPRSFSHLCQIPNLTFPSPCPFSWQCPPSLPSKAPKSRAVCPGIPDWNLRGEGNSGIRIAKFLESSQELLPFPEKSNQEAGEDGGFAFLRGATPKFFRVWCFLGVSILLFR